MTAKGVPAWLRDHVVVAGLLVLTALAVYLPAAQWGAFHFDDMHSIVDNPGVRTLSNVPEFFTNPQLFSGEPGNLMYRPVLLITFALDFKLWGYNASGWLLTNALIHAAAAVLVHRLALRLRLSDAAAAFAGAVFALHPAISETQNYVSSRSDSLTALLLLGALHLHIRGGVRGVAGAFACLAAGLLTKENAAPFCGVVALYELLIPRRPLGERALRAAAFGALYLAPAAWFLFKVRPQMLHAAAIPVAFVTAPHGADPLVGGGRTYVGNMLTQSRVQVLYLQMLLKPVGLSIDHDVAVAASPATNAAAIAIHLTVIVAAIRSALRGHRLFPLCVGWWWALSAVTFVQPLNVVMNEHRVYQPMIAAALLGGAALARVAEILAARCGSLANGLAIAAAPLACFVPLTVQRSYEWRTDESLWTAAVERSPLSPIAHMHLGATWHIRANETFDRDERLRLLDAALAEYAVSASLHPDWPDVLLDIGQARFNRGLITHDRADFEMALAAYTRFGQIVGASAERPQMLQAVALSELGEFDKAVGIVEALKAKDPTAPRIYDDLIARIKRKAGDKRGAAEAMERVVAIEERDGNVDGLLDLGWWYFEDHDLVRAQNCIQRALSVADKRPEIYKPYLVACRLLVLTGKKDEAQEMFRLYRLHRGADDPIETAYAAGGRTPGVFTGTAGTKPPR